MRTHVLHVCDAELIRHWCVIPPWCPTTFFSWRGCFAWRFPPRRVCRMQLCSIRFRRREHIWREHFSTHSSRRWDMFVDDFWLCDGVKFQKVLLYVNKHVRGKSPCGEIPHTWRFFPVREKSHGVWGQIWGIVCIQVSSACFRERLNVRDDRWTQVKRIYPTNGV